MNVLAPESTIVTVIVPVPARYEPVTNVAGTHGVAHSCLRSISGLILQLHIRAVTCIVGLIRSIRGGIQGPKLGVYLQLLGPSKSGEVPVLISPFIARSV